MGYNVKDLYATTMSALMADYGKVLQTTCTYSDFYDVTIERTPNFTICGMAATAWQCLQCTTGTHIVLDLSANVNGFRNDENNYIIENFFWFAEDVIFVPKDVMECRE